MKLLLVESPNKTKKIKSFLGEGWIVQASFGHVRDLPLKSMGIEPPDFKPQYVIIDRAKRKVTELKKLAQKADVIYLAMDPDREGEAIAWHLREVLGKNHKYLRVSFQEITKKAVLKSIETPGDIDFPLVAAQESRRVVDRIVGYYISPILTKLCQSNSFLSAGRVQSPAVRLVVEREIEIDQFISQPYFEVEAVFDNHSPWSAFWNFNYHLKEPISHQLDSELTNQLIQRIKTNPSFKVINIESKEVNIKPPAPFTTSTLQQAASVNLDISPDKTMQLAQKLYEEGYITYHRTDSVNLSKEAITEIRSWIKTYTESNNLPDLLPEKAQTFTSSNNSQEAHEGIRPTTISNVRPSDLTPEEGTIYSLIWQRTVGSQMENCKNLNTIITLESLVNFNGNQPIFIAKGSVSLLKGWKFLVQDATDENAEKEQSQTLPNLQIDSTIIADEIIRNDKKTKAPKRYTEASLIKKLESEGIGRPSTYAAILKNIRSRKYVIIKKKLLQPTELGHKVIEQLIQYFSFVKIPFTKKLEEVLDQVAKNKVTYLSLVERMYSIIQGEISGIGDIYFNDEHFSCPECGGGQLKRKYNKKSDVYFWACDGCRLTYSERSNKKGFPEPILKRPASPVSSDIICPKCEENNLILRHGKNGDFWGCKGWPKCKYHYDENTSKPEIKEVTE
jgi:DNA topoisomerase I